MLPDYYAVLGIDSRADLETIRQAYRRQAAASHPDHGGSHRQMVLVNEAWAILSSSEARARYDEARRPAPPPPITRAAADDVAAARRAAEQYPRDWGHFEQWIESVAADVSRAEYGKGANLYGFTWPTTKHSWSAQVCLTCGAIVGASLWLVVLAIDGFRGNLAHALIPATVTACGGAWIGLWLHQFLKARVRPARPRPSRSMWWDQPAAASIVVRCPSCEQQLSLPKVDQPLAVTCPACRQSFDLPPSMVNQC